MNDIKEMVQNAICEAIMEFVDEDMIKEIVRDCISEGEIKDRISEMVCNEIEGVLDDIFEN